MANWKPHVTVVGAGGMGALFGAILQEGGLEVILVDANRAHVDAINAHGLKIEGFGGDRVVRIAATTDPATVARGTSPSNRHPRTCSTAVRFILAYGSQGSH